MIRTATGTVKLASLSHARLDGLLEILCALQGQFFPYKIAGKLSGCVVQANSLTETRNSELGRNELNRMESAHPVQSGQKFELSHQMITLFANEWQRVSARERSKLHELTAALARQSTAYDIDNLNILHLVENRKLSRSILESKRGTILDMVTSKAEGAGGNVGKIDPQDMSQPCSCRGSKPGKKLALSVRTCRHEFSNLKTSGFQLAVLAA